jgi:hypothetical protein
LAVLRFELRALHLLGRYSTISAISPALYTLVIFPPGPITFLFTLPAVARITGVHYHTQILLVEMGTSELFAWTGLELQSFQSLLPEYLGFQG